MDIVATQVKPNTSNGRNFGGKKELVSAWSLVATEPNGTIREVVTARWYMGRSRTASQMLCTIWTSAHDNYSGGHGSAGGYGYDKQSAALEEAINSAGWALNKSISGVGDSASAAALQAIAATLGYTNTLIVRHG